LSATNHAKVTAACLALSGFVVAIIAGVAVENPLDVTLTRALGAMGCCFIVGSIVGAAGEHVFLKRLAELREGQRSREASSVPVATNVPAAAVPPSA
jgi:hypothetical protein